MSVCDLAQLENARTQERRYRTLLQQELFAGEQYDPLRTNLSALQATVQAERAAKTARIQLGYTTIRSPLDGRMDKAEIRGGRPDR